MSDLPAVATASLEGALEALEAEATALLDVVSSVARVARKAKVAAETGTVRDIPQTLDAAAQLAAHAAAAAERLRTAWHFDVDSWFASGEYTKELLASAAEAGVSAFESDERILCYPVIVQVSPSDASVVIDKKKDRRIRPSVVVASLGRLQQKEPKFKPEAFIESLAAAYDLVVASKSMGPGAPVKLVDVHSVLTIMPGTAREYTRPEFARDIYLSDHSGIVATKRGRRMSLPASALTRSAGVLRTVTRNGQAKDYAGICFEEVAMINYEEYVLFLGSEYLRGYVDTGGCAVKFAVADDSVASEFREQVINEGTQSGYVVASVDAATTRVHLMEQIFFEVARQVDWDQLAVRALRSAVAAAGFPAPTAEIPTVDELAAHYKTDARELKRDVDRELQQRIFKDYDMVQEFRIGMLRLCQAAFRTGQVSDAEHGALLEWLRGDLRQMSALKSALIYRRIARHNARQMLFSLPHWLATNGFAGLLVVVDIRRLGVGRRPPVDERAGQYYTRLGLLDAYEVLRQLIDSTDELARCCVVVIAAPELLTDEGRGLDAYQALKLRIFDEIRDRRRDNPFSSLVRLGREEVAV